VRLYDAARRFNPGGIRRKCLSGASPARLFLLLFSQDESLRLNWRHIRSLRRTHEISCGVIVGSFGSAFDHEIGYQLEAADVIIPLLSPDFLPSRYCERKWLELMSVTWRAKRF